MKPQGEAAAVPVLSEILDRVVARAAAEDAASFADLVAAGGLDPARDFVGASLRAIDLRGEDLRGFDFSGADLSGADFRRANVTGVRFRGANLTGAIGLPDQVTAATPTAAPEDFSIQKVKRLVINGNQIPMSWIPLVRELRFGKTNPDHS